jgi:hypothetical protein
MSATDKNLEPAARLQFLTGWQTVKQLAVPDCAHRRSQFRTWRVTQSSASLGLVAEPVWFCLKAQPKREHLAATALRRQFAIESFSPRLRFRKMT